MAKVTFHSPTHELIARELSKVSNHKLKIVDYGCGEGELLEYFPPSKIAEYQGYEVNKACIPVARKKWHSSKFFAFNEIDREKLPTFGKQHDLDVVVLIGVVQYLPLKDLKHVLSEAKRSLKPGGKILISCTTDHFLYSTFNIYRLFLHHYSVNRVSLINQLVKNHFQIEKQFERGLILTPFFSNILVFFFDALDKLIHRTKGELGPIGRKIRSLWAPIIRQEFKLNIDYGYTLFIVASK